MPRTKSPLPLALAVAFFLPAYSQEAHAETPLELKLAPGVQPSPPKDAGSAPLFISAERIEGEPDKRIEATGAAEFRQGGLAVIADRLSYTLENSTAIAQGHVQMNKEGNIATGPFLQMNTETYVGHMESPDFELAKTPLRPRPGRGDASRVNFEGKDKDRLFNTRYTTCRADANDWHVKVKELELDRSVQVGTAHSATIVFKDVPILYLPWMDFPLVDQRKSGFLTPSIGTTGKSGLEILLPYYWNIAPNRDATITPRLLSKRGLQLQNEFRYLEPRFNGMVNADILPNDRVSASDRYFVTLDHNQSLAGPWSAKLFLQKVSDDEYFRDLSTTIAGTSTSQLRREGSVSYANPTWTFNGRVLRFQTLQPASAPYELAPQLSLSGVKQNYRGADLNVSGEWADYQHPSQVNAKRFTLYPSATLPLTRSYGFITPKLGLHYTRYALGDHNTQALPDTTRVVPIASVDSGLFFERDFTWRGTAYRQTLEPRAYYLYVPFREQSKIPNFGTAEADFNFAQMFTENQFVGGDRIGDASQVTVALTSRLLETATGIERVRAAIGQRLYFQDQKVTLAGSTPRDARASDLLATLTGPINGQWSLDSSLQYSTRLNRTEKLSLGARYFPAPGKVANLAYRYSRPTPSLLETLSQFDLSAQWPLSSRWYGLFRWNYSTRDRLLLEGLAGLEYNKDCWALRLVAHRFTSGTQQVTNAVFIQLELAGLSSIGINPLDTLKRNISGYVKSTEIIP